MTQHVASAESRQRTAALLTDLWQRNLPLIEQRMALLEHAAVTPLTPDQYAEAADVAHKLAGSLGMFGYEQGTDIARDLEVILESPSPNLSQIASLTAKLRSIIFPKS
jgi:HPt (histidine-containing phosphotransfer) domain-containing protein